VSSAHASAWSIGKDDLVKVCIEPTAGDFTTVHHELGHNFYQRAYDTLPLISKRRDRFHEAATPCAVGHAGISQTDCLIVPAAAVGGHRPLARTRVIKVAFLLGLLTTSGAGKYSPVKSPADYNKTWWSSASTRNCASLSGAEDDFDPGAKYHVGMFRIALFLRLYIAIPFHRACARKRDIWVL
jgi:peptidyl-dipeptidase A